MSHWTEKDLDAFLARNRNHPVVSMAPNTSPTIDELAAAYERLGNVWKVGELFGMKGSTVHGRLKRAGRYAPRIPHFSAADVDRIKEYYANTSVAAFDLDVLAGELGRKKSIVCRKAASLGLTNKARPINDKTRIKASIPRWQDKPHPCGMAGKKHTPETLEKVSAASKKTWATWKAFGIGNMSPEARAANTAHLQKARSRCTTPHTRTKGGHRADLGGIFFRSSWEANYARYLNMLVKLKVVQSWEFEPETFWFENIKRGVRSYLVDFKVHYRNEEKPVYVEVKGWMDARSKTKIARFRKYYPQHRLDVVGAKEYYALQRKWASSIPNWESAKADIQGVRVTVRSVTA